MVQTACSLPAFNACDTLASAEFFTSDAVYPVPLFGAVQLGRHLHYRRLPWPTGLQRHIRPWHVWSYRDGTWQIRAGPELRPSLTAASF